MNNRNLSAFLTLRRRYQTFDARLRRTSMIDAFRDALFSRRQFACLIGL